jgi:hypothetical protein
MEPKTLFTFMFFAIVNSKAELKYNILGCPSGWKASGQAWYAPKYEKETWINDNPAFAGQTTYSLSFHQQDQNRYFPREYILCLICKNDLMSVQESSRQQRLIEVCGSNSNELKNKKMYFEMQSCFIHKDQTGVFNFYTYGFTLNWCNTQPVCAINVSLSLNFLYDALRQVSPILCSEYHKQHVRSKSLNLYSSVDLVCPSGFITTIEMHSTLCQGTLTSSLCILCSSEEAEFSVCLTKDCEKISPNINFNSLVIPDSNLPALDFVSKRYCGVKIDLDLTHYQFLNETNLIVCHKSNYENALAISLAVFCATTFLLIIIIIILTIKLCRRHGTDRQQSQEQDPPLADHVYYNTNDSGNRENHREDGNIEFLHVNPYYE